MSDFFQAHSRFFATSDVGAWPDRLSCRYEAIIESNRSHLKGARVLDLASHDGRWSLAALRAGAAHVTGLEVRGDLIKAAKDNMAFYDVPRDRFEFIERDINKLVQSERSYDVVLCLGYFYHTLNHMALFQYMGSTGAKHLILDGMVEPGDEQIIRVYAEDVALNANGLSDVGIQNGNILVGHPSTAVLRLMLEHIGYDCAFYDWRHLIELRGISYDIMSPHGPDNPLGDYARGARATVVGKRRTPRKGIRSVFSIT
jgi:hypothetical protein